MAFDVTLAIRSLHIVAAALWVGGAFFMAFVLGPSLAKAGPAAGPFMSVVMRRGGLVPFFLTAALVSILAGGYTYSALGIASTPFSGAYHTMITLGMIFALLAFLEGMTTTMPTERKLRRLVLSQPANGPPSAAAQAEMQALGAKQGKASAIGAGLLTIALLLMAFSKAF